MKIGHSALYFLLILVVLALVSFIFGNKSSKSSQILLQSLSCQSDKIDQSILDLRGDTSLIGAYISFNKLPISDKERDDLKDKDIQLDEQSWIFDYVRAEIPAASLCDLVKDENVRLIFIPKLN